MTENFNKILKETKEKLFSECKTPDDYKNEYTKYIFLNFNFFKLPQKQLMSLIETHSKEHPNPTDNDIDNLVKEIEELMKKKKCAKKGIEINGLEFLAATFIFALKTQENKTND